MRGLPINKLEVHFQDTGRVLRCLRSLGFGFRLLEFQGLGPGMKFYRVYEVLGNRALVVLGFRNAAIPFRNKRFGLW